MHWRWRQTVVSQNAQCIQQPWTRLQQTADVISGCQSIIDDDSECNHASDSFNVLTWWWELNVVTSTLIRSKEDFFGFRTVQLEIIFGRPILDMFKFVLVQLLISSWTVDFVHFRIPHNNIVIQLQLYIRTIIFYIKCRACCMCTVLQVVLVFLLSIASLIIYFIDSS